MNFSFAMGVSRRIASFKEVVVDFINSAGADLRILPLYGSKFCEHGAFAVLSGTFSTSYSLCSNGSFWAKCFSILLAEF